MMREGRAKIDGCVISWWHGNRNKLRWLSSSLSAGLSVVGSHHCISNCIVMRAMQGFYPKYYDTFWEMAERQSVKIPTNICHGLGQDDFVKLYDASIVHTKPLTNALGQEYKKILSKQFVTDLFMAM